MQSVVLRAFHLRLCRQKTDREHVSFVSKSLIHILEKIGTNIDFNGNLLVTGSHSEACPLSNIVFTGELILYPRNPEEGEVGTRRGKIYKGI